MQLELDALRQRMRAQAEAPASVDEIPAVDVLIVHGAATRFSHLYPALAQPGAVLVFAGSGREALTHLLSRDFAAILLETELPDMDALEIAELMRLNARCNHVPILFLACEASRQFIARAYKFGAADVVDESISVDALRAKIAIFAKLARRAVVARETADRNFAGLAGPASKSPLRLIIDGMPGLISYVDTHFRYRFTNKQYAEWLGKQHEDFAGKTVAEVFGPELFEMVRPKMERALRGHLVSSEQWYSYTGDKPRYARATYVPDTGQDGVTRGFVVVVEDVTDRKRAEDALRDSEERYRTLFHATRDGILIVDGEGRYIDVNDSLCGMLKASRERLIGSLVSEFMPPDRLAETQRAFQEVMNGSAAPIDFPLRAADGSIVELEWTSSSSYLPGLYFCICRELTERKRAAEALRRSERQLRFVVDTAPALISYIDTDCRYLRVNKAYEAWFGLPASEVQSKYIADAFGREYFDRLLPHLTRVLAGETVSFESTAVRPDGEQRQMSVVYTPDRDERGVRGFLALIQDITERKRAETERAALLEREQSLRQQAEAALDTQRTIERQLMLLVEASSALFATPESTTVVRTILDLARRFVDAEAHAVWRKDLDSNDWQIAASEGLSDDYDCTPPDRTTKMPPHPLAVEDVERSAFAEPRLKAYHAEGIRSFLSVPWRIRDEIAGSIVFYYHQPHRFTSLEIRVAAALGDLASAAMGTAVLYDLQTKMRQQAEYAERSAKFLAGAGEILASSLKYEQTLQTVADLSVPFFADWCSVDVVDKGGLRRIGVKHRDPDKVRLANELAARFPPREQDPTRIVLKAGRSMLVEEILDEAISAGASSREHADLIRQLGLVSLIIAPLVARGRILGVLTFATAESGRRYSQSDLTLAEEIAERAALAVDNSILHERALASEQEWQNVANSIPQLAWMADEHGYLFWYNQQWYDYTGTTLEQMRGWGWQKVHHPDMVADVTAEWSRCIAEGRAFEQEFPLRGADGHYRWFLTRSTPVYDAQGRVTRWFGTNTDINELRETRVALQTSELDLARRLSEVESLLQVTPTGLLIAYDRECRNMRVNRTFAEWVGVGPDENVSRTGPNASTTPYKVFKAGRELPAAELPMQVAAREGTQVIVDELDLVRDDGRIVRVFGYASPLFDENGATRGSVGAFMDITERTRAEEERQRLLALETEARSTAELLNRVGPTLLTEREQSRLAQSITDLTVRLIGAEFGAFLHNAVDHDGGTNMLYTITGAPREAFKRIPALSAGADFTKVFSAGKLFRSGDLTSDSRSADGRPFATAGNALFPVRSYLAAPVTSRSGDVLGALFFGHSQPEKFSERHEAIVTGVAAQAAIAIDNARLFEEAHRAQRALQQSNEELRRANADLEQFAYSASHDLKEPLRTMAIYTEMLSRRYREKLDPDADEFMEYIIEGARRMDGLVNDLLSYTQAAAITNVSAVLTDANGALANALNNLRVSIEESGAEITAAELPWIAIQQVHLSQLLQNLIGNALKYRGPERPQVHIEAQRQGPQWLFSVRDNGIGIDQRYQRRIFGLFKRLHTAAAYSGTGIGLAICQKVVERHGGRIWVESEPGKGSTFYFTLPA
jgi:PAS domain S-box-containing protein